MPKRKVNRGESRILTALSCNHTINFNPPSEVGDEVWCGRCAHYRIVVANVPEWSIYCLNKDCHYTKYFGADELSTNRAAHKHATSMGHRVSVREGYRVRSIVDSHGDQPKIPKTGKNVTTSILDWLQKNPDHVQSLRRVSDGGH